jgi:hypothetical protein
MVTKARAATKKPAATKKAAPTKRAPATKPAAKKASAPAKGASPSALIDARIAELSDWRGEALARIRGLIKRALPDVVEEWKWRGVPVWYSDGMLCTGETYRDHVKVTFAKGASLPDPARIFTSSLDGNVRRAVDLRAGDTLDERAFTALVTAAAKLNASR